MNQAAKFSPATLWSVKSKQGSRSVTSASTASFCANSEVKAPGWYRHDQLPRLELGVFIRASEPRPSTSCNGTTQKLAVELCARRTIDQWMPSQPLPSSAPANFRSCSAQFCHQPT